MSTLLILIFPACMAKFFRIQLIFFWQIYWNMTKLSVRSPLLLTYLMCLTTYWTQKLKKPANLLSFLGMQWEIPNLCVVRDLRENSEKLETLSRLSLLRYFTSFSLFLSWHLGYANFSRTKYSYKSVCSNLATNHYMTTHKTNHMYF